MCQRPSWAETFMADAENIEARSVLPTKVGAVLVRDRHPVMSCYNGKVAGAFNIGRVNGYQTDELHAEMNIICWCARLGVLTKGCALYVTARPCVRCAIMIAQSGIKTVFCYNRQASDQEACPDGVAELKKHDISVHILEKNG